MNAEKKRIDWTQVRRRLEQSQSAIELTSLTDDRRTLEILRRRAAELSVRRQTADPVAAGARMLVCLVGAERYGLELGLVHEVLPLANCTPVPGKVLPELLGVLNLRGKIRSVLSLARILGLETSCASERLAGHAAVVQGGGVELVLHVDQVERIALVSMDSLRRPDGDADTAHKYVRGVSDEGIIILDLPRMITDLVLVGSHRNVPRNQGPKHE